MLEVNDFNQVRIALASPEQIRSWSYGEVTKPETINYRTLKPEKDGLFCEKIFGPTKDFECYCGKYKRVRYKGIVCDKCGVEVARAKVRRERMGHVELASPVSHIWFVKGTPSKLGLLLDISPRNLERVLYFAQYMITEVDDAARQVEMNRVREQMANVIEERVAEIRPRREKLEAELEEANAKLQARVLEQQTRIEAERKISRDALEAAVGRAVEQAEAALGGPLESGITLLGDVIFEAGAKITKASVGRVQKEGDKRLAAFDKETDKMKAAESLLADTALDDAKAALYDELNPLQQRERAVRDEVEEQYKERLRDLEDLADPVADDRVALLAETRYRELSDLFGHIFKAGMGAEAVLRVLERLDLDTLRNKLKQEILTASGQRRKKATKRLNVVEDLLDSGNKPTWMIFQVLPVLPPDLRPMVQLDGGRFATSDLNDLYRRVINRNNRLKRLLDLGAPEIIIRNEKRMLQEAVDSLIDNGRRGRAVSGSGNHKLKSLSDMLKGKQGRFRQNLLGKRVDYSGRSVIVVGPELRLNQCGLPKRMALELFKPFVMHSLVAKGLAHNIKSAKRIVERARPEVWDVLDEVIHDRPVLLNRAPTLHRLGIQAFQPILIEGSAIQLHPLVCSAFNADFDGDQMAVHVPLSREAVAEARQILLSTNNLLSPASGDPIVAPSLDMVLGCYYMTDTDENARGAYQVDKNGRPIAGLYGSFEEAKLAFDLGIIGLRARIMVRTTRPVVVGGVTTTPEPGASGKLKPYLFETTVGRIIFNEVLPEEIPFQNDTMDRPNLRRVVAACYRQLGGEATAEIVDRIKNTGFHFATRSGVTIAIHEIQVPREKEQLLEAADREVDNLVEQYQMGLITDDERYQGTVEVWSETTKKIEKAIKDRMPEYGSLNYMASSGTKGNITQIRQMAGMRGLMADPNGKVIELPIRGSFREGLTVLEYFISTHGARKGLADTALRTADSGYLTRRLIDVAQDVIILEEDCGTMTGLWIERGENSDVLETMADRVIGRYAASPVVDEDTGEVLCDRNEEITEELALAIDTRGLVRVFVRTPLSCEAERGICALCYGRDLGRGELVKLRTAVGIIAAQSIGEPGTQLTMRTFHTGGVASVADITSGLPRVEEIFEARAPKGEAIISEIDGLVEVSQENERRVVRIVNQFSHVEEYEIPRGAELLCKDGEHVSDGTVLAAAANAAGTEPRDVASTGTQVISRISGIVRVPSGKGPLKVIYEEREEREYPIPAAARLLVETGDLVTAGAQITEGARNPQHILAIQGPEAVRKYMVEEVQKVYKSQGVNINDKHVEVITRQMLRRVKVDHPGDTGLLPGDLIDRREFTEMNNHVVAEGGEPATGQPVLLGVTKASLNTDSWLAAASFQETTRVLTNAAIEGKIDRLLGLKENVIIGKLIPARADIEVARREHIAELDLPESLLLEEEAELERMLGAMESGARSSRAGIATINRDDDDALDLDDDEDDLEDFQVGEDEE
ncbi:MAG: DNA-directed RNA polymerase subunit beta' [Dehalococcoidia bacterium]|nr:DNA-directed RNA polymerase subunit beta' [Dehalococcoidia bacterium]NUQ55595.1 DNA-directed RNA polymerase subunit beta' [Dehalococcoidia bacterium]RIL02701.1 MAG: DNA-directed RNA polymerase subunit beta' [bacterium]